jgi:predicted AAA+ superfamily ATPase
MYINRELETVIAPFLKRREAIAIVGPRQCGKTTFLEHLAEQLKTDGAQVRWLTFERRSDLALFDQQIEDFQKLIARDQYVIIDEFQYAKEGGQKLKYLYDTTSVKFIVSGSSSLELTFQTASYMVGRMLDFTLMPFSFREFLSHHDHDLHALLTQHIKPESLLSLDVSAGFGTEINRRLAAALELYARYGGYPAVALAGSETEKQKLLEGIVEKYVSRDLRELLRLAADDALIRLDRFLGAQIGSLVNYHELSVTTGLPYHDVRHYLSVLEKTYIVSLIRPFFRNRRTELVKNPKVYFWDTGVRNYLLHDFREVTARPDAGALMENCAHAMLTRRLAPRPIRYWRTKSKAEVDFVVEDEQRVIPIEVKYTPRPTLGRSYHSFLHTFTPPRALILTKDTRTATTIGGTSVQFIPVSYL